MTAGYEGLLPVQRQWFDHLMAMPMREWPQDLKDFITEMTGGKGPSCGDEFAHLVGCWVKLQRD